jgi:hypothetical protein
MSLSNGLFNSTKSLHYYVEITTKNDIGPNDDSAIKLKLSPGGIGELDVGSSVNFSCNRRDFILNRRFQIVQKPETSF